MSFVVPPPCTATTGTGGPVLDRRAVARALETFSDPIAAQRWARHVVAIAGRFGLEAASMVVDLGRAGAELAETLARADVAEATAAVRSLRLSLTEGA